jgi:hypothetical protein
VYMHILYVPWYMYRVFTRIDTRMHRVYREIRNSL